LAGLDIGNLSPETHVDDLVDTVDRVKPLWMGKKGLKRPFLRGFSGKSSEKWPKNAVMIQKTRFAGGEMG
jgi:hypothetical protein